MVFVSYGFVVLVQVQVQVYKQPTDPPEEVVDMGVQRGVEGGGEAGVQEHNVRCFRGGLAEKDPALEPSQRADVDHADDH